MNQLISYIDNHQEHMDENEKNHAVVYKLLKKKIFKSVKIVIRSSDT